LKFKNLGHTEQLRLSVSFFYSGTFERDFVIPTDLVEKFSSKEKELTLQCNSDKEEYFTSPEFINLQARYLRLRDSNDMIFGSPRESSRTTHGDQFYSNISMPMVKPRTLVREAMFSHNFRGNPLITLGKTSGGSKENAMNAQGLLNDNLRVTKFRELCFRRVKYDCARYGSAVVFSQFNHSKKEGWVLEKTPFGIQQKRGIVDEQEVVNNFPVHILQYFQEPGISIPEYARYRGAVRPTTLADIIADYKMNPDAFIKKNVKEFFKKAKDFSEGNGDSNFQDKYGEASNRYRKTPGKMPIDVVCMFNKLNTIKGNEANQSHYYIEMIDGKIIRFEHNPYIYDTVPFSIFNYYPREDSWCGNSDSEFLLPHENFMNVIMKKKADVALNALEQFIFYRKDSIDQRDWDARHESGGMVAVKGDEVPLNNILQPYQFNDNSTNTTDSIVRYLQQNADVISPSSASTRDPAMLRSDTAAAVNSMEASEDVQESHILEGFSYGLRTVGENNITLLQEFLADRFMISPDTNKPDQILDREQIMGRFKYDTETSLTKNKTFELMRIQNIISGLMNFKGSQDPSWARVNLEPIIHGWLKNADVGDMEEILPPAPPMQPGMQPPMPQPQIGGPVA